MNKQLSLNDLKVKSFVTDMSIDSKQTAKGGAPNTEGNNCSNYSPTYRCSAEPAICDDTDSAMPWCTYC